MQQFFNLQIPEEVLDFIIVEGSLRFIVLFDDESVQIVPFEHLMMIAPWLRRQCLEILMEHLNPR